MSDLSTEERELDWVVRNDPLAHDPDTLQHWLPIGLRSLARLRLAASESRDRIKQLEAQAIESVREAHSNLVWESGEYASQRDLLDQEVRDLALRVCQAKGKDALPAGLSVRQEREYQYDPEQALAWAKHHDMCLMLDTKAFEGLCTVGRTRPEIVSEVVVPKVLVAKDLRRFYPAGDEEAG